MKIIMAYHADGKMMFTIDDGNEVGLEAFDLTGGDPQRGKFVVLTPEGKYKVYSPPKEACES